MNHPLLRAALAAALVLIVAGCASDPNAAPTINPFKGGRSERELRLEADGLYRLARRSLDTADYQGALQRYGQLLLRFPFTDYATQAQLESIYAKYRSFDPDGALGAADRFLKEHPRHAAVDYVYYLRGLVNFQRGESALDWLFDPSRQDVGFARRAFDDFALLAQKYPDSRYTADARLRMVYLRNKIADHELSVVKYYVRRGAHVAAAKRSERILADYPGAPAISETLALLESAYREVGLTSQADDVRRVREANVAALGDHAPKASELKDAPAPQPMPAGVPMPVAPTGPVEPQPVSESHPTVTPPPTTPPKTTTKNKKQKETTIRGQTSP